MGKLVLFLADGTTQDVPLDRERVTIGRRADNDICLPYPAVSAEHAAVVTILADSFLEDLGSTNGTLVNTRPIAKHFLRDRDLIEIGRQKLVYVHDDAAKIDPPRARVGAYDAGERIPSTAAAPVVGRDDGSARPEPPIPPSLPGVAPGAVSPDVERFVAAELAADARGARDVRRGTSRQAAEAAVPEPVVAAPVLRVLTGPNVGRTVALTKPVTSIGRVGVQVAAVRRDGAAYRLVPIEGAAAPQVNGAAVVADGVVLHSGDVVEIAGARLEFQAAHREPEASTTDGNEASVRPK